ncbi:hypothetical protein AKJ37_01110 [candidate division MSBL1 archaeon SCGC-AAA259I09]|uniref:Uncharacterized protein n=1 Tax=candidate division MSBL1 archaeon SCGC-AAA259I09 TaxID=1698267 RepID=A0A133UVB1_9EURY|nr:hypothetical protein AKJ37_01110 [candidate division MSBL1 archaeon SCGC-AAA259I09]
MKNCCICSKEATLHTHGLWWCEEHYQYVNRKPESKEKDKERFQPGTGGGNKGSVDLKLDWM